MSSALRRIVSVVVLAVAAVALVVLYRNHREQSAAEAERDAPVVAPSRVSQDSGGAVVALRPGDRARIGLTLGVLRAASGRTEQRLPAEVMPESERAAVLRAPVTGRLSLPPGVRWPALGQRVAAGRPIAQVSDARPLSLPISGVVTRVAAQPGALVEAGQPLLEVADYSRPLVRVAWLDPAGAGPPARLMLAPTALASRVPARLVGPAAEADPVTRRPAYLYRAEHAWPGATAGTPALAFAPASAPATSGQPGTAALVPDAAVVQWDGLAWAYRAARGDRFERVRVATDRPGPGGWLVSAPLAPGDSVVVHGAEELLSEEFRARVTVGDESGE
jgi:multidrug efflux pump subunit AcrA (membrane-fusion protein)